MTTPALVIDNTIRSWIRSEGPDIDVQRPALANTIIQSLQVAGFEIKENTDGLVGQ